MTDNLDEDFRAWAESRVPVLRRRAFLLCGSWHTADDLIQETLIRVCLRWRRVAGGSPDAYAMRVLLTRHLDEGRRPWRRERFSARVPEVNDTAAAGSFDAVEHRDALLTEALRSVPLRQRAVLVLRFAEDMSVEQVAEILGISPGTVRSRCSRGAEQMRRQLARLGHPAAAAATAARAREDGR